MLQADSKTVTRVKAANAPTSLYFGVFVLFSFIAMLAAAGFNYVEDPFQFFRKGPQRFALTMMRHQIPGVVRNYPFDAAVLGNSLGSNLRPEMFSADPSLHVQNLTMAGSTLNEMTLVADLALRTKAINTMFWAIGHQGAAGYRYPDFPECLYSKIFEYLPYCYLLNVDILRESMAKLLQRPDLSRAEWRNALDGWQAYGYAPMNLHEHACQVQGLIGSRGKIDAAIQQAIGRLNPMPSPEGRTYLRMIVPLVDAHPQVRFVFFFTPIFITEFWREAWGGNYWDYSFIKQELLRRPNVKIFDFQEATILTRNPMLYRDLQHETAEAAQAMATWMTDGKDKYRVIDLDSNNRALQDELRQSSEELTLYFDQRCNAAN